MTEPEFEDRQDPLQESAREVARGSEWIRAGRESRRADRYTPQREYDREMAPRVQDGPGTDRTQWARPTADHNTSAARNRELAGDDWRSADLRYNEADQWRGEAEVADDHAEEALVAADKEPTADGQAAALSTAEHEADVAAASAHESALSYDSAERRSDMAADLESRGVSRETADNRVRADVSQARPAAEATRNNSAASRPSSRAAGQTRTRTSTRTTPEPSRGVRR